MAGRTQLRLYVVGGTQASERALHSVERLRAQLDGETDIEVVDLREQPEIAEAERIIATPLLVRVSPDAGAPHRRRPERRRPRALVARAARGGRMSGYEIARLPSGIVGLDDVLHGGLPQRRLSLVTGTAGAGKTLFSVQFLAAGIAEHDEPGVFVTFEERPAAIRRNFRSFGWDIAAWEEAGKWTFVDGSPQPIEDPIVAGEFDLASLVVRVRHAVSESGARRVAIDSTGSLVDQFAHPVAARRALFQIASELQEMGVTAVMTAERSEDYGPISRYGFEEFVADNVVILRNALEGEKRRRTIEVLKLRGGSHLKGEQLFTIQPAARAHRRAAGGHRPRLRGLREARDDRPRRARRR